MDYHNKYIKYKIKYNHLKKQIGGTILLYHGSPFKMEKIEPRTPRGDNEFNTQTGIYMTDNKMEAMLYALARDKERINKGWGIKDDKLILRKDLWPDKYKLNEVGYVHEYKSDEREQNPYNSHEYIIKKEIVPDKIIEVTYEDIKNNIKYVSRAEFYELFK